MGMVHMVFLCNSSVSPKIVVKCDTNQKKMTKCDTHDSLKRDQIFRCVSHMLGSNQVTTVCQINQSCEQDDTFNSAQSLAPFVKYVYVRGTRINILITQ
jgi:hypothetical protein